MNCCKFGFFSIAIQTILLCCWVDCKFIDQTIFLAEIQIWEFNFEIINFFRMLTKYHMVFLVESAKIDIFLRSMDVRCRLGFIFAS